MANTPHPSGRLAAASRALQTPVPSGTQERTDQGVDWGGIKGSVVAVGSGVISKIYPALSGFGYTIIEKLSGGQYVYYGLETGATGGVVREGQAVTGGQPVATGRGTGGIEVGYWNPATGRALGAPDYTSEGVATPAGKQFAQDITSGGATTGNGTQKDTLAQLWLDAGGDPKLANTMAAIAMAESGGKVAAQNASGAAGLWQILPSAHPQYNVPRLLSDPLYNAQAAVAVEKSQGLGAWATYTSGAYKAFVGQANKSTYTINRPGGETAGGAGGGGGGGGGPTALLANYSRLRDMPRTAPPNTSNPIQWFLASFTGNWDGLGGGAAGSDVGAAAGTPDPSGTITLPPGGGV